MSFGSRLKQAREQAGYTQQDLAKKLGVTKSAIGNYENGVSSPKEPVLLKIFDALRVDPNFLFQDSFSTEIPSLMLSPSDIDILRKFNVLDERGQLTVKRCIDEQLQYSVGKDVSRKIVIAAARDGSRVEVAEVSPEEEEAALLSLEPEDI